MTPTDAGAPTHASERDELERAYGAADSILCALGPLTDLARAWTDAPKPRGGKLVAALVAACPFPWFMQALPVARDDDERKLVELRCKCAEVLEAANALTLALIRAPAIRDKARRVANPPLALKSQPSTLEAVASELGKRFADRVCSGGSALEERDTARAIADALQLDPAEFGSPDDRILRLCSDELRDAIRREGWLFWKHLRFGGIDFGELRGELLREKARAAALLTVNDAGADDAGEYRPASWFPKGMAGTLRKAAAPTRKRQRVARRTIDGVVCYSVADARRWWPDRVPKQRDDA